MLAWGQLRLFPSGAHMPTISPEVGPGCHAPPVVQVVMPRTRREGGKRVLGGTGTRGVLQTDESVGDKGGNHTTPFGMTWVNNHELGGGGAHALGTAQGTPRGCSPCFAALQMRGKTNG